MIIYNSTINVNTENNHGRFFIGISNASNSSDLSEDTLYPPWDGWNSDRNIGGAVGWDLGWEEGTLNDVRIVTNCASAVVGVLSGYQACWNVVNWYPTDNDYVTFTFDYDYSGWVNLAGGGTETVGVFTIKVFFNIIDTEANEVLFAYEQIVEAINAMPFNYFNTNYDGNVHISSSPVYVEEGKNIKIQAGIICYPLVAGYLASFQSCVADTVGKLNYVSIQPDNSKSPLLRVSPNPPDHDFGDCLKDQYYVFNFSVWNGGIGVLYFKTSDDSDWMSVFPPYAPAPRSFVWPGAVVVNTSRLGYGLHEGNIYINSSYGNKTGKIRINIINSPPGIPLPPTGPTEVHTNQEYEYSATAYDYEGDTVKYLFDWGDGTDSGWTEKCDQGVPKTLTHQWTNIGTYTIKVKAKDAYGESDWSSGLNVTVIEKRNPPTADAGGPYYGYINQYVHFNGAKSHDNDENGCCIDRYDWMFYDGDNWHNDIGDKPTYKYTQIGRYTVKLRVYDNEGDYDIDSTTVSIDYPPMGVHIEGPEKIKVGQTVTLKAVAYGGKPPYIYRWNFNHLLNPDGWDTDWLENNTIKVSYETPGIREICVAVKDSRGETVLGYLEMTVPYYYWGGSVYFIVKLFTEYFNLNLPAVLEYYYLLQQSQYFRILTQISHVTDQNYDFCS